MVTLLKSESFIKGYTFLLQASWDEPTQTVIMHRGAEPSLLQSMALQLADKVTNLHSVKWSYGQVSRNQCYLARNFILLSNILQQHYQACFVFRLKAYRASFASSRLKERYITHLSRFFYFRGLRLHCIICVVLLNNAIWGFWAVSCFLRTGAVTTSFEL